MAATSAEAEQREKSKQFGPKLLVSNTEERISKKHPPTTQDPISLPAMTPKWAYAHFRKLGHDNSDRLPLRMAKSMESQEIHMCSYSARQ